MHHPYSGKVMSKECTAPSFQYHLVHRLLLLGLVELLLFSPDFEIKKEETDEPFRKTTKAMH